MGLAGKLNQPETFSLGAGLKFKRGRGGGSGGGGAGGAGGVKIEHRVGVQAPSDTIWELVHDLSTWKAWNPLYTEAQGEIRIGSVLTLKMELPGEKPMTIRPTVLEWVPREQLHWRLKMMGGLVSNTRYIEIEQLDTASCIVSNGEFFGGFLGPNVAKRMGGKVWRAFEAMNLALKAAAEAEWRAQGGAPTSDA
jgi:hypothetical protein